MTGTTPQRGPGALTGGAPKGSMNRLTTGATLTKAQLKYRLRLGGLPAKFQVCEREGRIYRRQLEEAVMNAKDEISIVDAHHIDTASTALVHASICRWCIRHHLERMKPGEIMNASAMIVKAKTQRDAAVKALELNKPPPDPWTFDALPAPNGKDDAKD